MGKGI
jgi:hypothetical protein